MSYLDDFEHSFMQHTLEIVRAYSGPFDASVLINCLLGLLVVPKETSLDAIPLEPLSDLSRWGINPASIQSVGRATRGNPNPDTIRGLVVNLRHSVAHFKLKPVPRTSDVHSFEFSNRDGLKATISLKELRVFVDKLADYLDKH
ncbi:MAG: HEPN family nuclease [Planctomycetota bacterium]|jgi:hypothetical protein